MFQIPPTVDLRSDPALESAMRGFLGLMAQQNQQAEIENQERLVKLEEKRQQLATDAILANQLAAGEVGRFILGTLHRDKRTDDILAMAAALQVPTTTPDATAMGGAPARQLSDEQVYQGLLQAVTQMEQERPGELAAFVQQVAPLVEQERTAGLAAEELGVRQYLARIEGGKLDLATTTAEAQQVLARQELNLKERYFQLQQAGDTRAAAHEAFSLYGEIVGITNDIAQSYVAQGMDPQTAIAFASNLSGLVDVDPLMLRDNLGTMMLTNPDAASKTATRLLEDTVTLGKVSTQFGIHPQVSRELLDEIQRIGVEGGAANVENVVDKIAQEIMATGMPSPEIMKSLDIPVTGDKKANQELWAKYQRDQIGRVLGAMQFMTRNPDANRDLITGLAEDAGHPDPENANWFDWINPLKAGDDVNEIITRLGLKNARIGSILGTSGPAAGEAIIRGIPEMALGTAARMGSRIQTEGTPAGGFGTAQPVSLGPGGEVPRDVSRQHIDVGTMIGGRSAAQDTARAFEQAMEAELRRLEADQGFTLFSEPQPQFNIFQFE